MRTPRVVLTGLALAVAGGGCEGPDALLESVDRPIIAGMADTGDPAMMEMIATKGNAAARCTVTLITPRILLTAAHCVAETSGYTYVVFPGNDDRNVMKKDVLAVKTAVFDPKFGNPRQGHDLAVLVLAAPSALRPVPLNRAALDTAIGKPARYVGYGLTNGVTQTGAGVKRQNSAPIGAVSRTLVAIGPNPHGACNGDSGGPMLLDTGGGEAIIGVGSFVDDTTCRRNSYYQRIDTQLAWIDEQIQKYDPGGLPPATDGGLPDGATDGGTSVTADAAQAADRPPRSGPLTDLLLDASRPLVDGAAAGSKPEPRRDAGSRDAEPEPDPETTNLTSAGSGGCACAIGARGAGASGAGWAGGVALALGALARRRRRATRG